MVREDNDGTVRQHAWGVVQQRFDDRFGDFWLLQEIVVWQLAHGGERGAIEAARALGANSDDPTLLSAGLRSPNANVRIASLDALMQLSPRAPSGFDFDALVEPLTADGDPKVAKRARETQSRLP